MNAHTPAPEVSTRSSLASAQLSAAEVDLSCRQPFLILATGALTWLVIGLFLALISSIKVHGAGFLAGSAWLTYGRVFPAALNTLAYGFASQAALAMAFWILVRLGRVAVPVPNLIVAGALVWNAGVAIGCCAILCGSGTGYEWLEMPSYVGSLLFAAFLLIGSSALLAFHQRRAAELYVSQWYLLAALLWFPWIYSTAQLTLFHWPVRGIMQEVVNSWFQHNFFTLWLTPVGLAALFYFIPKMVDRPLSSRYLAMFSFWTLAFFGGWGELYGGAPVPKWMSSVSIAANVLLLIPLLAVVLNLHSTLAGRYALLRGNSTLRFALVSLGSFVVAELLRIVGNLRTVNAVTQFTFYGLGVAQLFLFGFLLMIFAGTLFYVVPRMTETEWVTPGFERAYMWTAGSGAVIAALSLVLGGVLQGSAMNDASVGFVPLIRRIVPFIGLNTLGLLLLCAANGALLLKICGHLIRTCGCCGCGLGTGKAVGRTA
jgi:cytochrome c oxidase cbb3-type subunit I